MRALSLSLTMARARHDLMRTHTRTGAGTLARTHALLSVSAPHGHTPFLVLVAAVIVPAVNWRLVQTRTKRPPPPGAQTGKSRRHESDAVISRRYTRRVENVQTIF